MTKVQFKIILVWSIVTLTISGTLPLRPFLGNDEVGLVETSWNHAFWAVSAADHLRSCYPSLPTIKHEEVITLSSWVSLRGQRKTKATEASGFLENKWNAFWKHYLLVLLPLKALIKVKAEHHKLLSCWEKVGKEKNEELQKYFASSSVILFIQNIAEQVSSI